MPHTRELTMRAAVIGSIARRHLAAAASSAACFDHSTRWRFSIGSSSSSPFSPFNNTYTRSLHATAAAPQYTTFTKGGTGTAPADAKRFCVVGSGGALHCVALCCTLLHSVDP